MQNNQDNLPRNLIFMISLIISALAAYFLNSSLFSFLDRLFDISVSSSFAISLNNSSLWGIASYWSTFALIIFALSFLLPAISNTLSLKALKSRISELPRASDNAPQITKDKFLKTMSEFKLVYSEFAVPYSAYIVERQEKDISKKSKFIGKAKAKNDHPAIVSVLLPASDIFKLERVLSYRLSTWFMRPLARVLMGIGFLLLLLSISGALQSDEGGLIGNEIFLMGVSSLSLCIGVGVFIAALFRFIMGHIYHRASEVVKMIESLFDYKPGERENGDFKTVESAMNKTFSSIKDISKNLSEISEKQLTVLQEIADETAKQSTKVKDGIPDRFDKNSIMDDLNEVSKASDTVAEKFDRVAEGLDRVIAQIETIVPMSPMKKTQISADIETLKEVSNKTVGMGRRKPVKANK